MRRGLVVTLIVGLIVALVGYAVAFYLGKPILDNAQASTRWPSVEGVIQRSAVVTSRSRKSGTMYSAEVVYQYTVDGQKLSGSTVSFGGDFSSSSRSLAEAVTNRYPVRTPVQVFHEPAQPTNAVLEPGVTWKSYIVMGVGWLFLVVGGLMVAAPICQFLIASMVVVGAASGAIGRRKAVAQTDHNVIADQATSGRPSISPSPPPDDDDGFDIA